MYNMLLYKLLFLVYIQETTDSWGPKKCLCCLKFCTFCTEPLNRNILQSARKLHSAIQTAQPIRMQSFKNTQYAVVNGAIIKSLAQPGERQRHEYCVKMLTTNMQQRIFAAVNSQYYSSVTHKYIHISWLRRTLLALTKGSRNKPKV